MRQVNARTGLEGHTRFADDLPLSSSQRADRDTLVLSGKTPQRVVARAMMVLAAAEGRAINAIAQEFSVSRPMVYVWRDRFEAVGVLGLVKDAPGPGRRPALSPKKIAAVVETTLQTTPPDATH